MDNDFEKQYKEAEILKSAIGFEKLFNKLKEQGLFQGFSSYQNWREKKDLERPIVE